MTKRQFTLFPCACTAGLIAALLAAAAGGQQVPRRTPRLTAPTPVATAPDEAAREGEWAEQPRSIILVNTDREATDFLHQAETALAQGQTDKAIELLNTLLASDKRAFVRLSSNPRLSVSVREAARQLLSGLSREALEKYASQFDAPAAKLFDEAQQSADLVKLQRVAGEFFHTRSGDRAQNLLAAYAFDRSDFLLAAQLWDRTAREHKTGAVSKPLLLAKAAVAYHLAGDATRATASLRSLRSAYAGATIDVAGQATDAARFVEQTLQTASSAATRSAAAEEWLSPYGSARGFAAAAPLDLALFPLWATPRSAAETLANAGKLAGVSPTDATFRLTSAQTAGLIEATVRQSGQAERAFVLPALRYPLVVGTGPAARVIVRDEQTLTAYQLADGKLLWQSPPMPVNEVASGTNTFAPLAGDMGRYTLAAGSGNLYTVCGYKRIDPSTYRKFGTEGPSDGSTLAAVALADGNLVWEIGRGKGAQEALKTAKFLSAPTYHEGRLYVLSRAGLHYRSLCVDAGTGALVWETTLGPVPTTTGESGTWQAAYTTELLTERGTPPAVANGRVFFATNAGLIAALDAATGQPIWAHRYDSSISGQATDTTMRSVADRAYWLISVRRPLRMQNPLVVAGGRVLALPCDSDSLLSISETDGRLLWQKPREDQECLSYAPGDRVVLTGPDIVVLQATTGEAVRRIDTDVFGRPVIAEQALLASGKGKFIRVNLADYSIIETPLLEDQLALGSLAPAAGAVVAANAGGIACYAGSGRAWDVISARFAQATAPAQQAELRLMRAQFALSNNKLADALGELRQAAADAQRAADTVLQERVRSWTYQALLRQVDQATDLAQIDRLLADATRLAQTPALQLDLAVRGLRAREHAGRFADAAAAAQALSEKYAGVSTRWNDGVLTGYELGQREIARLIKAHGREVYAPFDSQAQQAVASAGAAPEKLFAAARRWRNTPAAAEALQKMVQAMLPEPGQPIRDPALAHRALAELRRMDPARANWALAAQASIESRFNGDLVSITPNLEPAFPLRETNLAVLRNWRGAPIAVGQRVVCISRDGLLCVDPAAPDAASAVLWRTPLKLTLDARGRIGQLSSDQRLLALIAGRKLTVFSTTDGKLVSETPLDTYRLADFVRMAGWGDRVMIKVHERNRVTCFDFVTRRIVWQTELPAVEYQLSGEFLFGHSFGRGNWLLNLRTGELPGMPRAELRGLPMLTGEELLAWPTHDAVAIYDPRHTERGAITKVLLPAGAAASLLACDARYILMQANELRVVDLNRRQTTTVLEWPKEIPAGATALAAFIHNDVARVVLGMRGSVGEGVSNPLVAAYRLPAGKLLWSRPLAPGDTGQCFVSSSARGDCLSVLLKPISQGRRTLALALAADGALVDCLGPILQADPGVQAGLTLPVVLNGHLVVETRNSVEVLRNPP